MTSIVPLSCPKCNLEFESILILEKGIIYKVCCKCQQGRVAIPFKQLPSIRDVKLRTWDLALKDASFIAAAKKDFKDGWIEYPEGSPESLIAYWRLYMAFVLVYTDKLTQQEAKNAGNFIASAGNTIKRISG